MCPKVFGSAPRRAMLRPVREAGMIVVWVEAIAEVATESITTHAHGPMVSLASTWKIASSSSAFSARNASPASATTAIVTER